VCFNHGLICQGQPIDIFTHNLERTFAQKWLFSIKKTELPAVGLPTASNAAQLAASLAQTSSKSD